LKVYVGGIVETIKEEDLRRDFERYGEVSNIRFGKGFAFIEMPDDGEANMAIRRLDGKDIGGRKLSVKESRPVVQDMPAWRRFLRAIAGGGV
jgi:RNA recognition motif-containing protein